MLQNIERNIKKMIFCLTTCATSVAIEYIIAGATAGISLLTVGTKIRKENYGKSKKRK